MSDHDPKTILRSILHTELATLAPEAVEDRIGRLVKSSVQPFIEMSKKVAELNKQLSAENSQLKDGTFVADAGERIAQLTQAKAELEERVRWFEERIKLVTIHPAEVFEWTGTREGYASSKNYQSRAPVVMERSTFDTLTVKLAEAEKAAEDWKRRALRDADQLLRTEAHRHRQAPSAPGGLLVSEETREETPRAVIAERLLQGLEEGLRDWETRMTSARRAFYSLSSELQTRKGTLDTDMVRLLEGRLDKSVKELRKTERAILRAAFMVIFKRLPPQSPR